VAVQPSRIADEPVARPPRTERHALEPGVAAAAAVTFLMTGGEELWKRFVPRYLEALGAPVFAVGAYGATRDLVDALLQYPGGWATDRFGRRAALRAFILLAASGYAVYLAAWRWDLTFVALPLVMCWSSAASPTVFAIIGDAMPRDRRTMGFTVQSIMRRIPIAIAPTIGGLLIASGGVRGGVRTGLGLGIAAAVLAFLLTGRIASRAPDDAPLSSRASAPQAGVLRTVWSTMPGALRRLLASDILVRTCESLVDVFVVLYVTRVIGISAPRFGGLVAIQMVSSMVVYVPAIHLARRIGRKALVTSTFVAFALFPLAVIGASGFGGLVGAFVIGGLREIGEPARKAVIVDLADARWRGRTTGLYYLVRSLAITPAALVGGALWSVRPELPFVVAAGFGLAGSVLFAVMVPASEVSL
jgi:MFS family permease